MNKRGMDKVVTTVLIILLVIILLLILSFFIVPFVQENLIGRDACFRALKNVKFDDSAYNCYANLGVQTSPEAPELSVGGDPTHMECVDNACVVVAGEDVDSCFIDDDCLGTSQGSTNQDWFTSFSLRINDKNVAGFRVGLYNEIEGSSNTIDVLPPNARSPLLRMFDGSYGGELEVSNDGGVRTYVAQGKYDRVDIYPILGSSQVCEDVLIQLLPLECLEENSGDLGGDGVCGNGVLEPDNNEECDEGGICGDGVTLCEVGGDDVCGDGSCAPYATNGCDNNCQTDGGGSYCGDGTCDIDEDCNSCVPDCGACPAECDDGVDNDGDSQIDYPDDNGCSDLDDNKEANCGDGTVNDIGEECDDANSNNDDSCLNTCINNVCGDGYVNVGVEECDDGNTDNGDGCSATCDQECVLGSAYWSTITGVPLEGNQLTVESGIQVFLSIVANDACEGASVTYTAWEDDVVGDDHVNIEPVFLTYNNGFLLGRWISEYQPDVSDPPEYYFEADVDLGEGPIMGVRSSTSEDEELKVIGGGLCGNNQIDGDEECDGSDLGSCQVCDLSCQCTLCGNGDVDPGEQCDGGSQVCVTQDGYDGTQDCIDGVCLWDGCVSDQYCGDGTLNGNEECDGGDFGGLTCADFGFDSGDLSCSACGIDTTGCYNSGDSFCGDGVCDARRLESCSTCPDDCDLPDPCEGCGNGIVEPALGEECDDGNNNNGDGCSSNCEVEGSGGSQWSCWDQDGYTSLCCLTDGVCDPSEPVYCQDCGGDDDGWNPWWYGGIGDSCNDPGPRSCRAVFDDLFGWFQDYSGACSNLHGSNSCGGWKPPCPDAPDYWTAICCGDGYKPSWCAQPYTYRTGVCCLKDGTLGFFAEGCYNSCI